ncbi:hypothetical protein AJ80_02329 [Polytolypa hystricis UAMH7299]|uniref:CFEM domain-containing protein n=1 Tax=Polytolypa hystricis (strain UAMH7299) TaxID=1447883 RepID=A0A2B7YR86_POLH7|nr:hypothetical protein AJ80_02329 [Polytolypa hystricis UAMH7299]
MKVLALLTIGALASVSTAQSIPGDISECGQMCINNMLDLGPSLGCGATDIQCLCSSIDFGYGVRDCSQEACPGDDLNAIQAAGAALCDSAQSTGTTGTATGTATGTDDDSATTTDTDTGTATGTVTDTATGTATFTVTGTSTGTATRTEDSTSTGTDDDAGVPYSTDPVSTGTIETDGSTIVSTYFSTLVSTPSGQATNSNGDNTATGTVTGTGTATGTATHTDGDSTETATDNAAAYTLAPVAQGLAGAIGIAALLVL